MDRRSAGARATSTASTAIPANKPNPCMRPIGPGPFFAVAVGPADLACSAGLRGDGYGRVLGDDGSRSRGFTPAATISPRFSRAPIRGRARTLGPQLPSAGELRCTRRPNAPRCLPPALRYFSGRNTCNRCLPSLSRNSRRLSYRPPNWFWWQRRRATSKRGCDCCRWRPARPPIR